MVSVDDVVGAHISVSVVLGSFKSPVGGVELVCKTATSSKKDVSSLVLAAPGVSSDVETFAEVWQVMSSMLDDVLKPVDTYI